MSCTDGMLSRIQIVLAGLILSTVMSSTIAYSDEGMWLFTNPPRKCSRKNMISSPAKPGSKTCSNRPCGSIAAAAGRLFRPRDW